MRWCARAGNRWVVGHSCNLLNVNLLNLFPGVFYVSRRHLLATATSDDRFWAVVRQSTSRGHGRRFVRSRTGAIVGTHECWHDHDRHSVACSCGQGYEPRRATRRRPILDPLLSLIATRAHARLHTNTRENGVKDHSEIRRRSCTRPQAGYGRMNCYFFTVCHDRINCCHQIRTLSNIYRFLSAISLRHNLPFFTWALQLCVSANCQKNRNSLCRMKMNGQLNVATSSVKSTLKNNNEMTLKRRLPEDDYIIDAANEQESEGTLFLK